MMTLPATLTDRVLGSRALAALTSPHGVDRYLERINPMWAATEVRARIVDIHRENPDSDAAGVATLTLQPTSTWRGHRAGQYVQVGLETPARPGRRFTRCFSISSAASVPGEPITLTVRAHDEGQVSKYLVHRAKPGQVLHLSQADGAFTLTESPATPTNNHLVFITGGSGITPAMSMVRTLLCDGYDGHANRKATFIHFARSAEDQIFADELAAITQGDNGVDVRLFHGDALFSAELLGRIVPAFAETDTWVCGPAGMVDLVRAAYREDDPRLRLEFFKTPVSTGSATGAGSAVGSLEFARAGQDVANTGASILEQAEATGLAPEFGCRMGICFSCTARKTSGTVRNVITGVESSLPEEDIQICVNAPVEDCVIAL